MKNNKYYSFMVAHNSIQTCIVRETNEEELKFNIKHEIQSKSNEWFGLKLEDFTIIKLRL